MAPILIAELCQNHLGDKHILQEMVHAAAEGGADYVKIQTMRLEDLTFRERFEQERYDEAGNLLNIKRPFQPERERLSRLMLDQETERWFVEECWRVGVAPLTTIFSRSRIKEVADLGFEAVKVASADCASYPMLKELKEHWGRLFVSTGGATDQEIEKAAQVLQGSQVWWLHCVVIYPTPLEQCHLRRMIWLRRFGPYVGWSDHTLTERDGLIASKVALALGADVVERHFTILNPSQTKDGPVSINPVQLKELREFANLSRRERILRIREEYPQWETLLGEARRPLSRVEILNRDYYRGRFASWKGNDLVFNWEDRDLIEL
ncbi:MAG: N-acetylneuraminate synthase family protein [Candidatus Methanomethylicaceae archaeon]